MAISGQRWFDFDIREKAWLVVLLLRGPATRAGTFPEIKKKARIFFEATTKIAVLTQIDLRVEDSGEDPAILEKIVSRRRFGGAVGQGSLGGQPGDEAFRADDGRGGKSRGCNHLGSSLGA